MTIVEPTSGVTKPPTENAALNPAEEFLARAFWKKRSRLIVEIDLDPVPGCGNDPDDHRALVQRLLDEAVSHYRPTVTIADGAA